jgi:DNA modification methylase
LEKEAWNWSPLGSWNNETSSHHHIITMDYDQFITEKTRRFTSHGFEPLSITAPLFEWQAHVVKWAVKNGRAALFEDCGLGKTAQQLEWASQVCRHTGGSVIILTPLSVARQTANEAAKFGIVAAVAESQDDVTSPGIWITNYEKLEKFDATQFVGVVLDESSILKNFTGKMRQLLTATFSETPYRLCCTATPSPNDYTEFGQHADFLGVCSPAQMLATFFINDTFNTGDWRLKKHAEKEFWAWLASWAACISKPSDIGFDDTGYDLPPLNLQTITVEVDHSKGAAEGELFRHATLSATTMHSDMRLTVNDRVERLADLVNSSDESWLVWCNTNEESEMLARYIVGSTEIQGSHTAKRKEQAADDFVSGKIRVLISKSGIFGYGMNFQNCCHVAFVGLSYSFEDFYQALRRSYRFGQTREVHAYIIQASTEGAILKTIQRKIEQHTAMQERMKIAAQAFKEQQKTLTMKTDINTMCGNGWQIHHGDCVRVAKSLPDDSVDFSVFSPPFADLFTYSSDLQDMGNCTDMSEFTKHFELLIEEIARILVPGREVAVHCVDLLSTKWKHGKIEFQDFSGEIIRAFWRHGFLFHSRITIWKSPVTEMQRTKAHGLLHKTLKNDSADSRVGCPDYLLVFRKPGENPKPVTKDANKYPVSWWQEVASPVWMTVDQGRVLNRDGARDNADERHICPLQLDVIERAIELWTNPGDLVYSPFTGIGSEGVGALTLDRRFIGSELKESYFKQACQNLQNAKAQLTLF